MSILIWQWTREGIKNKGDQRIEELRANTKLILFIVCLQ